MAALTMDINTPERRGDFVVLPVAANTTIYGGSLVAIGTDGCAIAGKTATELQAVGRAEERAVNLGAAGEVTVRVKHGIFCWDNSSSTDEVKKVNIGAACYIVDEHTVALTDGKTSESGSTATRSPAGKVFAVDDQGVWVQI